MTFVSIVLFCKPGLKLSWWLDIGGLERKQVELLQTTLEAHAGETTECLGKLVLRIKVDLPKNEFYAPPLAAVAPVLSALSTIGFSLVSPKPIKDSTYFTWMLKK